MLKQLNEWEQLDKRLAKKKKLSTSPTKDNETIETSLPEARLQSNENPCIAGTSKTHPAKEMIPSCDDFMEDIPDQRENFMGFTEGEILSSQKIARLRLSTIDSSPEIRRATQRDESQDHPTPNQNQALPSSSQVQVKSQNVTIVVEPTLENSREFFKNDVKLNKAIENSLFRHAGIIDIHKNVGKKLLVIKLKPIKTDLLNDILNITSIGDWEVRCKIPQSLTRTYGVIGPIGLETPIEQIKEEIRCSEKVLEIKRLTKGKEKIPTQSVRIAFEGSKLPENCILFYVRYPIRTFVDGPWQC